MYQYSFIGAGNMAEAFLRGILQKSVVTAEQILCCDISQERLGYLSATFPGLAASSHIHDAANSRIILLSVKPKQIIDVCEKLFPALNGSDHIIVSIAAGIPLAVLQRKLPGHKVVRAMPNTPSLVGAGATGFCADPSLGDVDRRDVQELFAAVGIAFELEESLLDVVTALSGGGPAYLCLVTEALVDAGVRLGLTREVSLALVSQTLAGTGSMIRQSGENPAVLREKVCSPGGTTIEGIYALEASAVRAAFIEAVSAACEKAKYLGDLYDA